MPPPMASANSGATEQTTYRVYLVAERRLAHSIAAVLSEILWPPADAVGLFDAGEGRSRVEAYFLNPPDRRAIETLLAKQFGAETAASLAIEPVAASDWVKESQAKRPSVEAGRFLLHGSHDRDGVHRRRFAIEIDAGQAFGTGHHGSTLGCLLALDHIGKHGQFHSIIDVGTGSGVLAIAASRLSHGTILATDNDPLAIEVAIDNASLNRAGSRIRFFVCAGFQHPVVHRHAPFDLIMANILARPLARLAAEMARFSEPGGAVILSGITTRQAAPLAAHYRSFGFDLTDRLTIGDWVTLTLRHRQH